MTAAADLVPVVILAAGQSRRMRGRDKLLEPLGGVAILRRQAEAALSLGVPVIVALPPAPHPRHDLLTDLPVERLEVADAAEGLSHSLRAAIAVLPEGTAGVMVMLGDLPGIGAPELATVLRARQNVPDAQAWQGATEDGAPGHPILLSSALFPQLADLTGDVGAGPLLRRLPEGARHLVPLPGLRARHDLDTPEDWDTYRAATGL